MWALIILLSHQPLDTLTWETKPSQVEAIFSGIWSEQACRAEASMIKSNQFEKAYCVKVK